MPAALSAWFGFSRERVGLVQLILVTGLSAPRCGPDGLIMPLAEDETRAHGYRVLGWGLGDRHLGWSCIYAPGRSGVQWVSLCTVLGGGWAGTDGILVVMEVNT